MILILIFLLPVFGSNTIPLKIQAVLLVKLLSYTKELGGTEKTDMNIGVLNGR